MIDVPGCQLSGLKEDEQEHENVLSCRRTEVQDLAISK
jgi:hypothetical protein